MTETTTLATDIQREDFVFVKEVRNSKLSLYIPQDFCTQQDPCKTWQYNSFVRMSMGFQGVIICLESNKVLLSLILSRGGSCAHIIVACFAIEWDGDSCDAVHSPRFVL